MHNLKEIRKDFDAFKKALEKRNIDIRFDKIKKFR
jgi:seryl-tRNA synthetase